MLGLCWDNGKENGLDSEDRVCFGVVSRVRGFGV